VTHREMEQKAEDILALLTVERDHDAVFRELSKLQTCQAAMIALHISMFLMDDPQERNEFLNIFYFRLLDK